MSTDDMSLVYQLARASVAPSLIVAIRSSMGVYGSFWTAWDLNVPLRTDILTALGLPTDASKGDFRVRLEERAARIGMTDEERDGLRGLDACRGGRSFVEYCGGIARAWEYASALGHDAEQDWLSDLIFEDIGDDVDSLTPDGIRDWVIQHKPEPQKEKCGDCGEYCIDPEADTYEGGGIYIDGHRFATCMDCYEQSYSGCQACEETVHNDHMTGIDIPADYGGSRSADRLARQCAGETAYLCECCAKDVSDWIEGQKEAIEERIERDRRVSESTGFARWFARHFDGLDGRPAGADAETVAWIGSRTFADVWAAIAAGTETGSMAGRFVSFLVLSDEHADIVAKVEAGGSRGMTPQNVALTYSAREWLRKAIRTVKEFGAVSV